MNALTLNMGADAPATMSSREIAELTGKQHAHVMRDIRAMTKALGDDPNLDHHKDTRGYVTEFFLPRDLTMTLVTGYRVDLRYKVIKRLEEYDSGQADPIATLNDPAAMRGLLLTYAEKVLALTPKARALDRIAETSGSMSITEAAKYLQIGPKRLIEGLQINGYIYRSRSCGELPTGCKPNFLMSVYSGRNSEHAPAVSQLFLTLQSKANSKLQILKRAHFSGAADPAQKGPEIRSLFIYRSFRL